MNKLNERMYAALNGEFKPREEEVSGKHINSGEIRTGSISYWNRLYAVEEISDYYKQAYPEKANEKLLKVIRWFRHLDEQDKGLLEAFVFIPEEVGLAKVDWVVGDYFDDRGFLHPKYDKKAVEAIYDSASRYFEDCSDLWKKISLVDAVNKLTPKETGRFTRQYRERMLKGIDNIEFEKMHEVEVIWANLIATLQRTGFTPKEEDFVKAVWKKSKTIPGGYLEGAYGAQAVIAEALMDRDPKGVVDFDYIRESLPYSSLTRILATLPVRTDNVENIRRNFPKEDVYAPIVKFVDKTIRRSPNTKGDKNG